MVKERTFVMMKPDVIQRGFIGNINSRFERKGIKIVAIAINSCNCFTSNISYNLVFSC